MLTLASKASQAADEFQLELGFSSFFNGKDLSGWTIRGGEPLEAKTEAPKKRFQVMDEAIVIDGKTKGNMVIDTVAKFTGDVQLKFQYLPSQGCNNDLYFRGVKFDLKEGNVKNIQLGEWNALEITVTGEEVIIKNNGEKQITTKAKSDSSPLGLRAEFGAIQFRQLRSKP